MFVRPIVIENEADGTLLRNRPFDPIQKMKKLLMTVARLALRNDRTLENIQRGKQRSRSVTPIVVCLSFRKALAQR